MPETFLARFPVLSSLFFLAASSYDRRYVGLRPTLKIPPHARKTSATHGNSMTTDLDFVLGP